MTPAHSTSSTSAAAFFNLGSSRSQPQTHRSADAPKPSADRQSNDRRQRGTSEGGGFRQELDRERREATPAKDATPVAEARPVQPADATTAADTTVEDVVVVDAPVEGVLVMPKLATGGEPVPAVVTDSVTAVETTLPTDAVSANTAVVVPTAAVAGEGDFVVTAMQPAVADGTVEMPAGTQPIPTAQELPPQQTAPVATSMDATVADEAAVPLQNGPRPAVSANQAAAAGTAPATDVVTTEASSDVDAMRPMAAEAVARPASSPDAGTTQTTTITGTSQPTTSAPTPATPSATAPMPTPLGMSADENTEVVRQAVSMAASSNGKTMTVRLDPPSLGTIRVQVRISAGGESVASIGTSNDVAHSLVRGSLDQLRASLERSGVAVDRIHVTRMSAGGPDGIAAGREADARGGNESGQGDGRSSTRDQSEQGQRDQQRRAAALRRWYQDAA